jgi:hypothetical protein
LRFVFRHGDVGMIRRAVWLSMRRVRWHPRWVHMRALATGVALAPAVLSARRAAHRR